MDVDLVFTDVVMPGLSGTESSGAARAPHSTLKVLFASGYTQSAVVHGGRLDTRFYR